MKVFELNDIIGNICFNPYNKTMEIVIDIIEDVVITLSLGIEDKVNKPKKVFENSKTYPSNCTIYSGGNNNVSLGTVLHNSKKWSNKTSVLLKDNIYINNDVDILKPISEGKITNYLIFFGVNTYSLGEFVVNVLVKLDISNSRDLFSKDYKIEIDNNVKQWYY